MHTAAALETYLNHDLNLVNGARIKPRVRGSRLWFLAPERPVMDTVVDLRAAWRLGDNEYRNVTYAEPLEYSVTATYLLDRPMRVLHVESGMDVTFSDDRHTIWFRAEPGQQVGPVERVLFRLSRAAVK
jgi:hypothetical protein